MKTIDIKKIKTYEKNPRKNQPVKEVAKSIKEFGFNSPIIVDKDYVIIAGHTRFKAAKYLKMKEVPVVIADLTEEQAKAYRIIDNKTSEKAEWDNFLLEVEMKELQDSGFDLQGWDLNLEIDLDTIETPKLEEQSLEQIEQQKQLTFLYTDKNLYAKHFEMIQQIKYHYGYDTDDQIIDMFLSLYKEKK